MLKSSNPDDWNVNLPEPFVVADSITRETAEYLAKVANPDLEFSDFQKLREEFSAKATINPEYRLAYLRQVTNQPDMHVLGEMHELERQLRMHNGNK